MDRPSHPTFFLAFTMAALLPILLPGTTAQAAQIALVPVDATVPHTLVDKDTNGLNEEIILFDTGLGVEVALDIMLYDWDQSAAHLKTWQAEIDSSTYDNDGGPLPDLIPLGWPLDPALGAFIDTTRPDWVFEGFANPITALATSSLNYRYGATLFLDKGPPYAPPPKYGATLILMVPAGATGTFQVAFGSQTFMRDHNSVPIEPLLLTSAEITVVPEPSLLALLLGSFGALALVTHLRRHHGHPASARTRTSPALSPSGSAECARRGEKTNNV
jgi:hypothetical protein